MINNKPTKFIKKPISDEIVKQIIRSISIGEYPPGSKLPGERVLSEKYNVSRLTIRNALQTLLSYNFLDIRPKSGAYVRKVPIYTLNDQSDGKEHILENISYEQYVELRTIIEPNIVSLSAKRITQEELVALEDVLKTGDRCLASGEIGHFCYIDEVFHRMIARSTKNPAIIRTYDMTANFMGIARFNGSTLQNEATLQLEYNERAQRQHWGIFEALQKGDVYLAREEMMEHLKLIRFGLGLSDQL